MTYVSFYKLTVLELRRKIHAIPSDCRTVRCRISGAEDLRKFINVSCAFLRSHLTTLDLTRNFFGLKFLSAHQLKQLLVSLKGTSFTTLNLGNMNYLHKYKAGEMVSILRVLPTTITSVDISGVFREVNIDFRRDILRALPKHIKHLFMDANDLSDPDQRLMAALPDHLVTFGLGMCKKPDTVISQENAKAALLQEIKCVARGLVHRQLDCFDLSRIDLPSYSASELLDIVREVPKFCYPTENCSPVKLHAILLDDKTIEKHSAEVLLEVLKAHPGCFANTALVWKCLGIPLSKDNWVTLLKGLNYVAPDFDDPRFADILDEMHTSFRESLAHDSDLISFILQAFPDDTILSDEITYMLLMNARDDRLLQLTIIDRAQLSSEKTRMLAVSVIHDGFRGSIDVERISPQEIKQKARELRERWEVESLAAPVIEVVSPSASGYTEREVLREQSTQQKVVPQMQRTERSIAAPTFSISHPMKAYIVPITLTSVSATLPLLALAFGKPSFLAASTTPAGWVAMCAAMAVLLALAAIKFGRMIYRERASEELTIYQTLFFYEIEARLSNRKCENTQEDEAIVSSSYPAVG